MHLYSLCQTWLNLKTHTVSETENRTSCLTTVSQTITVSSCQSDIIGEGGEGEDARLGAVAHRREGARCVPRMEQWGARGLRQGAAGRPAVGSRQQSVGGREQLAGGREEGVGHRGQGVCRDLAVVSNRLRS